MINYVRRYFEITHVEDRFPKTYVEYFGSYGDWAYRANIYRWEYVDKDKHIFWFIGSNLVVDYHHVVRDLLQRTQAGWETVNLATVSNQISLRKPAMSKKKK